MKFGPLPLAQAEGHILGHNIADSSGRRALRKGRALSAQDIATLRELGRHSVYVAVIEADDVLEDAAGRAIAAGLAGPGLRTIGAAGGRVNLLAEALGVARVDVARLNRINDVEGVTVASVPAQSPVRARQLVATIKIIPYAVPRAALQRVQDICGGTPIIGVDTLPSRTVAMILSGSPSARERIVRDFDAPIRKRIEALGSTLSRVDFVPLEDESGERELAEALEQCVQSGCGLVVLAGETAIMDRYDIAPRAIERAGGEVVIHGAPVDPGNLLMVGYVGALPVLGAPGCARSPKTNVVDWVLPRLLVGDRLSRADVASLGAGGLLDDISERGQARE